MSARCFETGSKVCKTLSNYYIVVFVIVQGILNDKEEGDGEREQCSDDDTNFDI